MTTEYLQQQLVTEPINLIHIMGKRHESNLNRCCLCPSGLATRSGAFVQCPPYCPVPFASIVRSALRRRGEGFVSFYASMTLCSGIGDVSSIPSPLSASLGGAIFPKGGALPAIVRKRCCAGPVAPPSGGIPIPLLCTEVAWSQRNLPLHPSFG